MFNYYPIKLKNQHGPIEPDYRDYIDTSSHLFFDSTSDDIASDIKNDMSSSVFDMRREFKKNIKNIKNFYSGRKPKVLTYKFEKAKFPKRSTVKTSPLTN